MNNDNVRIDIPYFGSERYIDYRLLGEVKEINKSNDQILNLIKDNNQELKQMKKELEMSNSITNKILENQIKELEKKEEQRYFKKLSFHLYENIDIISKINHKKVLVYLLEKYYDKLKKNLLECNNRLEEIDDKLFNKKNVAILENINQIDSETLTAYKESNLFKLKNLISDYLQVQNELTDINSKKPEPKDSNKISPIFLKVIRIIGIAFFGQLTCFFLYIKYCGGEVLGAIIISAFILLLLIYKEIKYIKNKKVNQEQVKQQKKYQKEKKERIIKLENKQNEIEGQINSTINKIEKKFPNFKKTINSLNELEKEFYNIWI